MTAFCACVCVRACVRWQESSPSCSVESELVWATQRFSRLQEVLSLLTSPAEQLQSALENENLPEFMCVAGRGFIFESVCCLSCGEVLVYLFVQMLTGIHDGKHKLFGDESHGRLSPSPSL